MSFDRTTKIGFGIAALASALVIGSFALAQNPPPPASVAPGGFGAGGFGGEFQPQMMYNGPQQIINDPAHLFLIRGDRVIRIDKSLMKIDAEVMIPNTRFGPPPGSRPGGGPGTE